jgi:FkbM family methyltransferase
MNNRAIRALGRWAQTIYKGNPDRFLKKVTGVIHVGANLGQERDLYKHYHLRVVWIEPIPEIYKILTANIQGYPEQVAVSCLVTDKDGAEYAFHVANNEGASSSILELNMHKDIWPAVAYERTISLRSKTLASLLTAEHINLEEYNALVMDTQGSELLVLTGAVPVLDTFRFIKTEVSDFESYTGCCQLKDIDAFVKQHGFHEIIKHKFATRAEGGRYYEVVYERNA